MASADDIKEALRKIKEVIDRAKAEKEKQDKKKKIKKEKWTTEDNGRLLH